MLFHKACFEPLLKHFLFHRNMHLEPVVRLDGEEVPTLGRDLEPYGHIKGRPYRLRENNDIAFTGTTVLGLGFTLKEDEKEQLITCDGRSEEVIQPYVIGRDLNQRADCSASRWIINFRDWSLERAEEYPACIDTVRELVKPERDDNNYSQTARERWWLYERSRPELYDTIQQFTHVLAIAQVSNTLAPARVLAGQVFDQQCVVFALDDFAALALLSSSIHASWVIRYALTKRTDITYTPSDVFLTFPRPVANSGLEALGRQLDETRKEFMLSRGVGLTKTYRKVHDPDTHEAAIQELRDIHVAIDEAVMRAYGWDDLDLKIGHHPTKIGIRWTVSKEARFQLLDRLLEENDRRYALENPS